MTASQLFSRLETAKEQLRSAGFLELTELTEPAAGEEAVRAMEQRLNVRFPEPLRSFWTDVANLYGFYVSLTDDAREELEVDPSAAQLEIVRVTHLTKKSRGGRELIRFTNDGWGNGWALDVSLTPDEAGDIVWVRHDGPEDEALTDRRPSLEALFDDLEQSYFLGGEIGELLEERLPRPTRRRPTGKTIAPRAAARPAAEKPAAETKPSQKRTAKQKKPTKKRASAGKKAAKKAAKKAVSKPKRASKKPKAKRGKVRPKSRSTAKKPAPKPKTKAKKKKRAAGSKRRR